ncbi:MAG: hypothetical protein HFH66_08185 [Lachnospiraceae bacterium]|nr:hypothetical protein [Lachnospiraceae bacterium]
MFEIRHLAGILMLRDQEMVSFQVDDTWVDFEIITPAEDLEWKPFDFWNGYSRLGIQEFLKDRLPPLERDGIVQSFEDAGIPMEADAYLHFSCGRAVDDDCWIKFPDGPQTWEECQRDLIEKSDMVLEKQRKRMGIT